MAEMSDSEFFGAGTPTPQVMSDDQFMNMGATAKPDAADQSAANNLLSIAKGSGEQSAPMTLLQLAGTGAQYGYQKGFEALPQSVQNAVSSGAKYVSDLIPQSVKSEASDIEQAHPVATRTASALMNLSPAEDMMNLATSGAKAALETSPTDFLKNTATGTPDTLPTPKIIPSVYDPDVTHAAISDSYGAAKDQAGKYYDFMRSLGEDKLAPNADKLKDGLDSIISDVQNQPFHEAQTALPKLMKLQAKMEDNIPLSLNDVVDLKQALNSNFNPKRFIQAQDTPYGQLASLTDNSLKKAAEIYPDFGEAKSLADKNWVNTVALPFQDNKVLQKFWKPEDYFAKQSVENGIAEDLPDATKQRAATMLDKIGNPVQLDAVRRVLPQDLADTLSQEKIDAITKESGTGRLSSLGKAITGAPNITPSGIANTGRNLMNVISPQISDADQALIDAAKSPAPRLSTKYQQPFAELQATAGQPKFSMLGQKALPAPEKQLALPAQNRPFVNDSVSGELRPMTDDELAIHNMSPSDQAKRMQKVPQTIKPDELQQIKNVQDAVNDWNNKYQTLLGNGKTHLEAVRQLGNPPEAPKMPQDWGQGYGENIRRMQSMAEWDKNAQALQDAGYTPKEVLNKLGKRPEAPTFKSGGTVNTNPSEAQIAAGNYSKGHMKLHGLDITIENPKGSIRSGIDKNGKKWQCRLPASYGYIKQTQGGDGEHVDCYIGPRPKSEKVWVIDQKHLHNGKFDEQKVFLGFPTKALVLATYRKAFSDGKADDRIQAITECTLDELKNWLKQTKKDAA